MTQSRSLLAQVNDWVARDPDATNRDELAKLLSEGDTDALSERFQSRLQFGTAGLRGIVGAGPNRMNRLVVQETSAGLARYVLSAVNNAADRGVVIAYDARPDSRQFATDAASVILGVGLQVYLTEHEQPTPVGAFGVMALNAAAGIVVTASHNPPEYNGYKVYWENGAQIIPPHDRAISEHIEQAAKTDIPWMDLTAARSAGRLHTLGEDFVTQYRTKIVTSINAWRPAKLKRIGIAYTALHGVGASLAEQLIETTGVATFHSVASQHEPDGSFPTVAFPNPEEDGAMDAVIALAQANELTLACANDPDADRLAVAARNTAGQYKMLSGDQIGILLGDYCLQKTQADKQIVAASLVSSRMLGRIAEAAGATYFETLTGFKWLANTALQNEVDGKQFLFAYEEALGYALGQAVRDKDGLSALVLFAQMTGELAAKGDTVFDRLEALYRRHGIFLTHQHSLRTASDAPSITNMLRHDLPKKLAGIDVVSTKDLETRVQRFADGRTVSLESYPSDVVIFYLADDSRVIVRPSGTEPKTKCYYEVTGSVTNNARYKDVESATAKRLKLLVERHQDELTTLLAT